MEYGRRFLFILICVFVMSITGCRKGDVEMIDNLIKPGYVPQTGGVSDHSDPSAVKEIQSDELKEFRLRCENSFGISVSASDGVSAPTNYPAGYYNYEMIKSDDGAEVSVDFAGEEFKFTADNEELSNLAKLLKDHDVASMNGHSKRNSALGTYIDFEALYESGEKISIYAEGGASVEPDNWNPVIYVEFFDGLIKKYTGQSYGETLLEDKSDPDALKEFTSDHIQEIYLEFDTNLNNGERDGFEYGTYRFQMREGGVPYQGVDTNAAVWRDAYIVTSFDMTDAEIAAFQEMLNEKNYLSLNGWDKKDLVNSYSLLELHVYYDNGESLTIDARGDSAMPPGWNSTEMLHYLQALAEAHGTSIK